MAGPGRPTLYSVELACEICARLAEGSPLCRICLDPRMPAKTTVYRWLGENEEFRALYNIAREDQADTMADEMLAIADECDSSDVKQARLRIDTRKWLAMKLKPKKYGEKIDLNHTGSVPVKEISDKPLEADEWLEKARGIAGPPR